MKMYLHFFVVLGALLLISCGDAAAPEGCECPAGELCGIDQGCHKICNDNKECGPCENCVEGLCYESAGSCTPQGDSDRPQGDTDVIPPENCTNSVDDDQDGRTDCADQDCESHEYCVCGNDVIGADELCDGTDLGGNDCTDHGFYAGVVQCNLDCNGFVTDLCHNCGDEHIDDGEECDGSQLGVSNGCRSLGLGYTGGVLRCDVGCMYDVSGCLAEVCDNGVDDDNDGTADCNDTDCLSSDNCAADFCPTGDLLSDLGDAVVRGSTIRHGQSVLTPQCVSNKSKEMTFHWIVPADGNYVIDTAGSNFRTVLAMRKATCLGDEIACITGDGEGNLEPTRLTVAGLKVAEEYIIIVDGNGQEGDFTLNINKCEGFGCSCTPQDLGSAVGNNLASSSTAGSKNLLQGSCGGNAH